MLFHTRIAFSDIIISHISLLMVSINGEIAGGKNELNDTTRIINHSDVPHPADQEKIRFCLSVMSPPHSEGTNEGISHFVKSTHLRAVSNHLC